VPDVPGFSSFTSRFPPKQAAFTALGEVDFVKNVVVIDGDIDPYNEQEVMYAVATRTQANEDFDIIKNSHGQHARSADRRRDPPDAASVLDAARRAGRAAGTAPDREVFQRRGLDRKQGARRQLSS
jgi:3-polyprenyl-4-hydroxybenzoate decarboxylase